MKNKFNINDIVYTKSNYSSDCYNHNKYAGGGYRPNYSFKVYRVEKGTGMWNGTWLYFGEYGNGMAEFALENVAIIRDKALEKLGIEG